MILIESFTLTNRPVVTYVIPINKKNYLFYSFSITNRTIRDDVVAITKKNRLFSQFSSTIASRAVVVANKDDLGFITRKK